MAVNGPIQGNVLIMNARWGDGAVHDQSQAAVDGGRFPLYIPELPPAYNTSSADIDTDDGGGLDIQYAGGTSLPSGISSSNSLGHGRLSGELFFDFDALIPGPPDCSSHHDNLLTGAASNHPYAQQSGDPSYHNTQIANSHEFPFDHLMNGEEFPYDGNGPWGDGSDEP